MPASDQGVTLDRYMFIPRVLIFVTRGDFVLLLKGAPTKRMWANRYNGLGGHIERGETPLSAARRELLEEAGLLADLWLCGSLVVDTGQNPGICIFIFTGKYLEGELKSSLEGTLHWMGIEEISDLPVVEDLPVLLDHIRKMQPGDPPFSMRSFYEDDRLRLEFVD